MKLYCILLTIAFVKVSPIMTAEYANAVYLTNEHIKNAFDALNTVNDHLRLAEAMSEIVNGNASMEKISLMWAVPDKANFFTTPHDETLAIQDQETVRRVIHENTNTPMPQVDPNLNIENEALSQLGEERRKIIGPVARHLLLYAILLESPEFENLHEICPLIGLVRSIRYPDSYTRTATVSGDECVLTSQDDSFKYKPFQGDLVLERQVDRHIIIENFTQDILAWLP